ncbi:MAG TPA: hypothetical protein VD694_01870 [Nitrososphaeraceae archaeon]|nr:hypothetical protein [Nitrososphaeraceae archaeon]
MKIKSLLKDLEKRIDNEKLSRTEKIAMKVYQVKAEYLKYVRNIIRSFADQITKVKHLMKWLRPIFESLNIVLDSLQKIFPQLGVVKEFKEQLRLRYGSSQHSAYQTSRRICWMYYTSQG